MNEWGLAGTWFDQKQVAVLRSAGGKIVFRFHAIASRPDNKMPTGETEWAITDHTFVIEFQEFYGRMSRFRRTLSLFLTVIQIEPWRGRAESTRAVSDILDAKKMLQLGHNTYTGSIEMV